MCHYGNGWCRNQSDGEHTCPPKPRDWAPPVPPAPPPAGRFCPVYEQDGNRLIVTHTEFVGATRDEAFMIALGSQLVETILLGMTYTGEILDLPAEGTPHVKGTLGPWNVAIVGGPMFDAVAAEVPAHV